MQQIRYLPLQPALPKVSVVIQPQPPGEADCQRRETDRAHQRNQVLEDRDRGGEDEGQRAEEGCAGDPGGPVGEGVGLQVFGGAEDSDEDVFRADLLINIDVLESLQEGLRGGREYRSRSTRAMQHRTKPF